MIFFKVAVLTSVHLLQLFRRMLFAVKLQKWFVDYATSPKSMGVSRQ